MTGGYMPPDTAPPVAPIPSEKKTCGLVMPISSMPGCSAEHWAEVRSIIDEAVKQIEEPKFDVRLVSDADDAGVIQKRIVQNVYTSDIIVCDVSAKNSNVMFELGLRLAFDKPVVLIKDDQTDYSFDTGIIEHISYPRDLRFAKIMQFKKSLADKVLATYKASQDPQHSSFLKNFGTFHVKALAESDATPDRVVLEMLQDLQLEVGRIRRDVSRRGAYVRPPSRITTPSESDLKEVEARGRLMKLLEKYMTEQGIKDVKSLGADEKFSTWLVRELPAHAWFTSAEDFNRAIDEAISVKELIG
jgi:nucleoside 2-deoxyribosyltransferase